MKRVLISVLAFALLFVVLTTWLAPSVFIWWFTPPAGLTMTFDAPKAVQWGMSRLVHAQIISLLAGAVVGLVLGIVFRRKAPPPATPTAATAKP